jgi:sulfur transfer protein SufE
MSVERIREYHPDWLSHTVDEKCKIIAHEVSNHSVAVKGYASLLIAHFDGSFAEDMPQEQLINLAQEISDRAEALKELAHVLRNGLNIEE